ncbi:MAG: hypothetical protein KDA47_06815, partial [Planctomycetales bacterium]|nr:hypothetical protein [Planctomycetales bacterium]
MVPPPRVQVDRPLMCDLSLKGRTQTWDNGPRRLNEPIQQTVQEATRWGLVRSYFPATPTKAFGEFAERHR